MLLRDKEVHFIMTEGWIHEKGIAFLNVHVLNNIASIHMNKTQHNYMEE